MIGVLLLVPSLLVGLGRALRRLPLPFRLPIRDAARQRSRSASAVAAVTATVATLTILAVANASDDQQNRRDYSTNRIAGHGYIDAGGPESSSVEVTVGEIRRQHPDWRVYRTDQLGVDEWGLRAASHPVVAVVLPGCSPEQAIASELGTSDPATRCARYGSNADFMALGAISEASLTDTDVAPAVAAALRSGGMIIADPQAIRGRVVRLALGTARGQQPGERAVDRVIEVPAVAVSADDLGRARRRTPPGLPQEQSAATGDVGLMTIEGALRQKIPGQTDLVRVR